MKFEEGAEYKTIKKSGEIGMRTFKVEKISRKNSVVRVSGAINGIFKVIQGHDGNEYINLDMSQRNYQNPCSTDIIKN